MPEIQIQYVNERQGNRPPSIKDTNGVYYTLSDAAYGSMRQHQGQSGLIEFKVNNRGYNVATHWNGAELPRDQKGGPPYRDAAQPVSPAPRTAPVGYTGPESRPITPPRSTAPFGYVDVEGRMERTMPTVREQFAMKVVESYCGAGVAMDEETLIRILYTAKSAWIKQMEGSTPAIGPADPLIPGQSDPEDIPPWIDEFVP